MSTLIWDQNNLELVLKMWGNHLPEEIALNINEKLSEKYSSKKLIPVTSALGVVFAAAKLNLIDCDEVIIFRNQIARRNSKKRNVTANVRNQVLIRDGNKCLLCGSDKNLTMDHIKPFQLGGDNGFENLQTLCRSCNSVKMLDIVNFRKPFERYCCDSCNRLHFRNTED